MQKHFRTLIMLVESGFLILSVKQCRERPNYWRVARKWNHSVVFSPGEYFKKINHRNSNSDKKAFTILFRISVLGVFLLILRRDQCARCCLWDVLCLTGWKLTYSQALHRKCLMGCFRTIMVTFFFLLVKHLLLTLCAYVNGWAYSFLHFLDKHLRSKPKVCCHQI